MLDRLSSTNLIDSKEEGNKFDLREAIGFVWRQWKFITCIVAVILLVAGVYISTQTPRYTASAQILLEPQKETAAKDAAVLSDSPLDYSMIESHQISDHSIDSRVPTSGR